MDAKAHTFSNFLRRGSLILFSKSKVSNKTLPKYLQSQPQQDQLAKLPLLIELCFNICCAIQHAHDNKLVLGSLRCRRIVIGDDGSPRLPSWPREVPFNLYTDDDNISVQAHYQAPESIFNEVYTQKTDIFHFGLVMFDLAVNFLHHPYNLAIYKSINNLLLEIGRGKAQIQSGLLDYLPREYKELVLNCIQNDLNMRPNIEDIKLRLQKMKETYHQRQSQSV